MFHGQGKLVTRFGHYEGGFANNLRKGKGTFEWKNGDLYVGMWENNFMHGVGKYVSRTDNVYTGQWVYGVRHGRGVELTDDGTKYDGEFIKNKRHGNGIIRYANGKWREGIWKNGEHFKWIGALRIGGVKSKTTF